MIGMNLDSAQKDFPMVVGDLDKITDPVEYDNHVHEMIRKQLQDGGLISPTENITNFQTEPEDTPGFLDSMLGKMWKSSPAVYDSSNPEAVGNYMSERFEFITGHEDFREKVYNDVRKKRTIGYGFNLDEPTNRALYKNALKKTDKDFDALRNGTTALSQGDARILFEASAGQAERLITNRFGDVDLKGFQRLALVSLAYNSPSLIGPNLTKALKKGDLEGVDHEIRNRSNLYKIKGITTRRILEANMFKGMGNDSGTSMMASVFGPKKAEASTGEPPKPAKPKSGGSIIPSNVRSLVSDIVVEKGLVQPINDLFGVDIQTMRTEDFFDAGELDGIRRVVLPLAKKKKKGSATYTDYSGDKAGITFAGGIPDFIANKLFGDHDENKVANEYIIRTTLGSFNYEVDDRGHVIVTDQFNFNDAKKIQKQFPTDYQKMKHLYEYSQRDDVGYYGMIRRYAALYGSEEGKGAKFKIDLGPLSEFPTA